MNAPVFELYPGASDHPFAAMMVELLCTNLRDHPSKLRDFASMSGRVALVADDADTACTLCFRRGKLTVHAGMHGVPDLLVRGPSEALIDLSRIPPLPRAPQLPDPRSAVTRSLARALYERRLTFHGFARHLGLGLRLSRVLSIYG
jgi:hypothetical protein